MTELRVNGVRLGFWRKVEPWLSNKLGVFSTEGRLVAMVDTEGDARRVLINRDARSSNFRRIAIEGETP